MSQRMDVPATRGNAPQTGARVTTQVETTEIDPSGRAVRGVRVSFVLPNGSGGSVFLSDADYTIPNVRAAVAARAGVMAEAGNITT